MSLQLPYTVARRYFFVLAMTKYIGSSLHIRVFRPWFSSSRFRAQFLRSCIFMLCFVFWQRNNRETRQSPAPNCKREGVKFHFILLCSVLKSLTWKRPPSIYGFRQILPTHPCYYNPRLHPPRTTLGTGKYVITTLKTVFFKNLFRKWEKSRSYGREDLGKLYCAAWDKLSFRHTNSVYKWPK